MIILATGIASTSAQSVSNRLNPFSTKKGDAYFIGNKKLSERSKDIKRFVFDMTYVSHCDSLTMNFTVVSPNREDISRLSVSNGTFTTEASDVKLLYHETKGRNFVVRTTAQLSYKDIKKLYTSRIRRLYLHLPIRKAERIQPLIPLETGKRKRLCSRKYSIQ